MQFDLSRAGILPVADSNSMRYSEVSNLWRMLRASRKK